MVKDLKLEVGIKTDPVEYRYSYEWLFELLEEVGVHHAQLGSFFELYQLPDEALLKIRSQAERFGVKISSVFTSHRELGGFFLNDLAWEKVARKNYERLIEIGELLGCSVVGSSPGAVYRDRMETKTDGINCYLKHMKELMHYAKEHNIGALSVEVMSCAAEPPSWPDEVVAMCGSLAAYHQQNSESTCLVGSCADTGHGYADKNEKVQSSNLEVLEACVPYLVQIHLKNTDRIFNSTYGFGKSDREKGIVSAEGLRDFLLERADRIPVQELVGYLEITGPKTGRDYTDYKLRNILRSSLKHLNEAFRSEACT